MSPALLTCSGVKDKLEVAWISNKVESNLTSPLWLFNWLERRVKRTEGTESTRHRGTNTAAYSVQLANQDLRGFINPSCFTTRALFRSEKASFKLFNVLGKLELIVLWCCDDEKGEDLQCSFRWQDKGELLETEIVKRLTQLVRCSLVAIVQKDGGKTRQKLCPVDRVWTILVKVPVPSIIRDYVLTVYLTLSFTLF